MGEYYRKLLFSIQSCYFSSLFYIFGHVPMVNACWCDVFGHVQIFGHIHSVILNRSNEYSSLKEQSLGIRNLSLAGNIKIGSTFLLEFHLTHLIQLNLTYFAIENLRKNLTDPSASEASRGVY